MRWDVDWNRGSKVLNFHCGPRVSSYWVVNGYVVHASGMLKDAVGCSHLVVARELYIKGFPIQFGGIECVPPTQKYHKQLAANVDALLGLLEQRSKV